MIWSKSKKIGCALQPCSNLFGNPSAGVIVCHYDPPGNLPTVKPYTPGPSCGLCAEGETCKQNLCTKAGPLDKTRGPTPEPTTPEPTTPGEGQIGRTPPPTTPGPGEGQIGRTPAPTAALEGARTIPPTETPSPTAGLEGARTIPPTQTPTDPNKQARRPGRPMIPMIPTTLARRPMIPMIPTTQVRRPMIPMIPTTQVRRPMTPMILTTLARHRMIPMIPITQPPHLEVQRPQFQQTRTGLL